MLRYLLRRLPSALLVLFLASIVVFAVLRMIPGDPATSIAGPDASPEAPTPPAEDSPPAPPPEVVPANPFPKSTPFAAGVVFGVGLNLDGSKTVVPMKRA